MKPGDGCTYTEAIRDRKCYQCGAPNAEPHPGETVPYCADCRKAHVKAQRKAGHE